MDELLKVIHDFRKRKIDLSYIENNKELLADQLTEFINSEPPKECNPDQLVFIDEIMVFAVILGLKSTNDFSIDPFYPYDDESADAYGDFITEILPECFLILDDYNYDFLVKCLMSKKEAEELFIFKSPIFRKLFRECYLNKDLDYFNAFIEKHKNDNLYDLYADDIVDCVLTYDPIKAGKYVDYFKKHTCFGSLDGPFHECKLLALSNIPFEEEILFSREQMIACILFRLQSHFNYKIYKDGKITKLKYPRLKDDFYAKLDGIEKDILRILRNDKEKTIDELIEDILNIDVSDVSGLDTDYLFTKFDRQFFIANVLDGLMCGDIELFDEERAGIVTDEVINEAYCTFMDTIEEARMSIKEYDEIQKIFPSYVIEEFAEDIGRNGFLDELDIPLDDNPNAKA